MLIVIANILLGILAGWGTSYALKRRGVSEGWSWFWGVIVGVIVFALDIIGRLLAL